MSVQLIVYPQSNPNGIYTYTQVANQTQYVGTFNFYYLLFATNTTTTSSSPPIDVISAGGASTPLIGVWKTWSTSGGTYQSTNAPGYALFANSVTLKSSASGNSSTGLYQLIDGLTVGQDYEITYKTIAGTGTGGDIYIGNQYGSQINVGNTGFNTCGSSLFVDTNIVSNTVYSGHVFTATDTTEALIFEYINDNGTNAVIDFISIKEVQSTANSVYLDVHDGQVILDLYEDTSIPLTLNVDNFKDAAERPTSYSKSFRLPGTKRNNQIFGSLFDVTISTSDSIYSFNPYRKTSIRLKEDGYTIFDGLLKLIDITDKNGEISYNVNLYSNTTSLKEILEQRKLGELDLAELEHDYTHTNIINSFTGVLSLSSALVTGSFAGTAGATTTDVLKYPLCDWSGNFELLNDQIFIGPMERGFQPWIKCRYLIDKIFSDAGLNFESNFFDTTDFKKLYLDWNTGGGIHGGNFQVSQANDEDTGVSANDNFTSTFTGYTPLKFTGTNSQTYRAEYYAVDDSTFTATRNGQVVDIQYNITIKNTTAGSEKIRFRLRRGGSVTGNIPGTYSQQTISGNSTQTFSGNVQVTLDSGDTIQAQIVSETNSADCKPLTGDNTQDYIRFTVQAETMGPTDFSMSKRADMSQWDFISGIIKMFNLVVLQSPPGTGDYRIEPYVDIFQPYTSTNDVQILDWTDRVDAQEFKLSPINTLKKRHTFTYKKDTKDYVHNTYSDMLQGYVFGSFEREELQNDFVTGETKIELPFAPTIDKYLFGSSFACPAIFSKKGDDEYEHYDNLPRILYDNGVYTDQYNTFGFRSLIQNGSAAFTNQTTYLRFSHYIDPIGSMGTQNYNFGNCDFIGPGPHPIETLYSEFWSTYIDELYHNDTRVLNLKINLYASDISTFRFFDIIRIKNREYRVNKIDYKPGDISSIELIAL